MALIDFQEIISVPFHINRALFRVYGLARLDFKHLTLEFQSIENLLGILRGRIKTIAIPYAEIMDIHLEKGKWGERQIHLRTFHLNTLQKLPTALQGVCSLQLRRSDILLAELLVSQLELRLTEVKLKALEQSEDEAPEDLMSKLEQAKAIWEKIKGLLN